MNRFHSACVREREGDLDSVLSERMCLQCLEKSKRQTESRSIPTLPVRFETGPCYLIIWPMKKQKSTPNSSSAFAFFVRHVTRYTLFSKCHRLPIQTYIHTLESCLISLLLILFYLLLLPASKASYEILFLLCSRFESERF